MLQLNMKIQLISDCHLNWADLELPGGDLLIAAGDIMEAGHLRLADNTRKPEFVEIANRYRRFIKEEFSKYKDVIYILGNHEHYNNAYQDTYNRIKRELPANVHLLENETIQIGDVHFFGATFWTDMNKRDPITLGVIENGMYDFRAIRHENGTIVKTAYGGEYYTNRFNPGYVAGVFKETVEKLKVFLDEHVNDKVVVVSHHAPSPLSVHAKYINDFHMNFGYHSHLTEFIMDHPQIKYWVHGHMHDPSNYLIDGTRVLSNPRGYKGEEPQAENFDPGFNFEV